MNYVSGPGLVKSSYIVHGERHTRVVPWAPYTADTKGESVWRKTTRQIGCQIVTLSHGSPYRTDSVTEPSVIK